MGLAFDNSDIIQNFDLQRKKKFFRPEYENFFSFSLGIRLIARPQASCAPPLDAKGHQLLGI